MDYEKVRQLVIDNLYNTIDRCWFGRNEETIKELEDKGIIYVGKVRDSFPLKDGTRAIVVSDRVSAFDKVANRAIPFKGQILNQTSNYWFERTRHIVPNHFIESPHPNVSIVHQCIPLPIEMIVRGYITGSGWRDYEAGKFEQKYGIKLPPALKKNQKLDEPILTPTTKAPKGEHDKPIKPEEAAELVGDKKLYEEICEIALKMYEFGVREMKKIDAIFVDTKYEFGTCNGTLMLIDEVNTSDSSRFWRLSTYQQRFENGEEPEKFDKEILRQWILSQGYDPKSDMPLPELTDEIVIGVAMGYIENYEKITRRLPTPISEDSMAEIEAILLERGLMG
ncbi:MAG: phosphoribosylaminoimidazolesuccinocarboxamide synthase [Nanoarchaeota archaeon]|nr:phosphoribosylaminoimidazolesuccinocarboxamide synthase [Nanoarchaeota archaeon]